MCTYRYSYLLSYTLLLQQLVLDKFSTSKMYILLCGFKVSSTCDTYTYSSRQDKIPGFLHILRNREICEFILTSNKLTNNSAGLIKIISGRMWPACEQLVLFDLDNYSSASAHLASFCVPTDTLIRLLNVIIYFTSPDSPLLFRNFARETEQKPWTPVFSSGLILNVSRVAQSV
jgi:hypothetical protein